jgi:putative thioredoxin
MPMDHNLSDFQTDVLDRSQHVPVLVDFWAAWCGPCKMLGPVLEKLAAEAGGRWALVKIDTEAHQDLAARFNIRGIPDVKLFHRGAMVAEFSGALPEPQLRAWLAQNLPTPKRDTMARARELLHAGRATEATTLLLPIHAAEPADEELTVLTARALVFAKPAAALALVTALPPASPWAEGADLVHTLAAAFHAPRGEHDLPDSPLRPRYLAAIEQLRRESFDAGISALIEVLGDKPGYADGRAKAVCLAIFRHLGLRHSLTEKFSRPYSQAVNV